jgi:hypothetical protein
MKKITLTVLLLLSLATILQAQKWSAGYRSGMALANARLNNDAVAHENLLWNNQLFLNRKIAGRLEVEITATYNYKKSSHITTGLFDGPDLIYTRNRTSTLTAGIYLRYFVYQNNNWRLFAQAGVGSYKSWNCYEGEALQTINSTPSPFSGKETSPLVWAHTLEAGIGGSYNISKRFYLHSLLNVGYKTDGPVRMSANATDYTSALYAGAGFRF